MTITNTLGEIEAALLKVQQIKGRATQAYLALSELRWQALMTLAQPRPGDEENGLLDGIDLASLEWAETITAESKPRQTGGRRRKRQDRKGS